MIVQASNNPEIYDRVGYRVGSSPDHPQFMPALAQNNGWSLEYPRWIIIDKLARVAYSSTEIPTEDELLKQLTDAGIEKRSQLYKNLGLD